jgi:hypothetical protein
MQQQTPTATRIERVEVFPDKDGRPLTWRVEAYDDDGGVAVNIFSGGDAKERAVEYAAWRYGFAYREPQAPDDEGFWLGGERDEEEEPPGFT